MAYARPVLCRLCDFPAPDGGVPVSEVDREKLSEWCLRMLDTELDQEGLEKSAFCQLCVSEARFEHINSVTAGDKTVHSGWWKTVKILNWEKFHLGDEIQPCSVQMVSMSAKKINDHLLRRTSPVDPDLLRNGKVKVYQCFYCPEEFSSKLRLKKHAIQTHKDSPIFSCNLCSGIFKSKLEKSAHSEQVHHEKLICVYCGAPFKTHKYYLCHVRKKHKKEAIQCKNHKTSGFFFKTEAELEEHNMTTVHKSDVNRIQCVYCTKCFAAPRMSTHIAQKHKSEAIRCDLGTCATYFLSEEEKQKHFEEEHLSKREHVECVYCEKIVFAAGAGLKKHIKKHHASEAIIRCNFSQNCPTYFLTQEERQQHIRDVHEARVFTLAKCVYCAKMYTDYRSLKIHVTIKHSEVMIQCKWIGCHKYCLSHLELEQHFQEEHQTNEDQKTHQCQKCPFKTCKGKELQTHNLVMHGVERLQCPHCPKVFKSQLSLSRHMRNVHNKIPRQCGVCLDMVKGLYGHLKKRKCLNCAFVSNCSSEYVQHLLICAKKHKCHLCKETFKYKSERNAHVMNEHIRAEAPSRNDCDKYCGFCYVKFSSQERLEKHCKGVMHQNNIRNAPFTCDFCQKQYPSMRRIYSHIKSMHLQDSPFPCLKCEKEYLRKENLKIHLRKQHSEPKFVNCDLCSATLANEVTLKTHRISVHQIFEK